MKLVLIAGSEEADRDSVIGLALERLRNFFPKFKYLEFDKLGVKPGKKLEDMKSFSARLHEKLEKTLVFRVFKPDSLIIMESSPGDLVREPRASEEILKQQELDRNYGTMYASLSDTPVRLITIEKSNIAMAVDELLGYLRMVFKG